MDEPGFGAFDPAKTYHPLKALGDEIERRARSAKDNAHVLARTADVNLRGRKLTSGELREIRWMFGMVPGVERARIYPRNFWWPFRNNRAMAPDGNIYFPSQDFREDFSLGSVPVPLRALFMHEATHLYQWYGLGMWVPIRGLYDRGYGYELKKGMPLRAYGLEQMGQIVQDYYTLRQGEKVNGRDSPLSDYADVLPVRR